LVHLKELSQLEDLRLDFTKITDKGMDCLSELTSLRNLDLGGTAVTAAGLVQLQHLQNLRTLRVMHTSITQQQLQDMQDALPPSRIIDIERRPFTEEQVHEAERTFRGLNIFC
jgi:hypothetical protein